MTINEIKELPIEYIKNMYCRYLEEEGLKPNTIQTSRTDAFYLYEHSEEIAFWSLIMSNDFEKLAREQLELVLNKKYKGNIKSNINGYMYHIRKLKKFIYTNKEIDKTMINADCKIITDKYNKEDLNSIDKYIPMPTAKEVDRYVKEWSNLENYRLQEHSLNKLFFDLIPKNTDISDILIKTATLNDFYSTNIYYIFGVAQHILSLDIDDRLTEGDVTLVNDIKNIKIGDKQIQFYSFATKYCSHHNPNEFPIYDSFVEKVLCYFQNIDKFSNFKKRDLKDYTKFKSIIVDFQKFYNLEMYSLKEIDKFLWQFGKIYFPKNYNKKR